MILFKNLLLFYNSLGIIFLPGILWIYFKVILNKQKNNDSNRT